jgi:UDP-N-acetylglucosamine:LPS N-acetylglucosamine transferase
MQILYYIFMFYSLFSLQHVSASCHLQAGYSTLLYKTLIRLKYAVRAIIKILKNFKKVLIIAGTGHFNLISVLYNNALYPP